MRKHLGVDFNEGCPLDGRKKLTQVFRPLLVSVDIAIPLANIVFGKN